jgi:hypothetical protein
MNKATDHTQPLYEVGTEKYKSNKKRRRKADGTMISGVFWIGGIP